MFRNKEIKKAWFVLAYFGMGISIRIKYISEHFLRHVEKIQPFNRHWPKFGPKALLFF